MAGKSTVENVDINLTATDKASRPIDAVADKLEGLDDVELELAAKDDASKPIAAVKGDADELDKADPTVEIHSSGGEKLQADIHEILDQTDKVERSDPTVKVDVTGADKAAAELKNVGDQADHAGERAEAQTGGLRDISGALGDIGGAGLDAADGLIGMGETIGAVVPQLAPFAGLLGQVGLAVGVGSLLYAGLQALPGLLGGVSAAEQIAKDATDKLAKSFRDGGPSVASFNKELVEFLADNPDTVAAMNLLGVSAGDISRVVNGQTSPAIDNARRFLQAYKDEANRVAQANAEGATTSNEFAEKMGLTEKQARDMAAAAETVIATTDGQKSAMKEATKQTDEWNKALRGLPGTVPVEVKASDGGSLQEILDRMHEIERTKITVDVQGKLHVGGAGAMAGTPYHAGGELTVGEAGPERVILPRGARVMTAGDTANADRRAGAGTVINYFVNVTVPVGSPTAEVGRYVADALEAHERRTGSRRRAAA